MSISRKYAYKGKSKEGAYYVWIYQAMGERSELFISEWRVPTPIPREITVTIRDMDEAEREIIRPFEDYRNDPELKYEPIVRNVEYYSDHTQVVRYNIRNMRFDPPFNAIYIPHHFFTLNDFSDPEDYPQRLQVMIEWDL